MLKLRADEAPLAPYRPGDDLPDVDLAAARLEAEAECGMPLVEQQLASYLMYRKGRRDCCAHKVQFELNGQSRTVRVTAANAVVAEGALPLAEPGNPWHVAAPMPGAIVNVAVSVSQRVNASSTLFSLEVMKRETHVAADRDAEVEAVGGGAGDLAV